jgi:hypothetical protein
MNLSHVEKELLIKAFSSKQRRITKHKTQAGSYVLIDKEDFGGPGDRVRAEENLAALNSLMEKVLIRDEDNTGVSYCLTNKGSEIAKQLSVSE